MDMQDLILISTSSKNPETKNTLSHFVKTADMQMHSWLAEGEYGQWAVECFLKTDHFLKTNGGAVSSIRNIANSMQLDINLISEKNRRKKILLADMDSTLIKGESLDEIAAKVGIGEEIANITRQSMRGELDFNQSIMKRVAMLKGIKEDILLEIIEETHLNNGASLLAPTMKKSGAFCYIVSGGFDFLTIPIAQKIGFDGSFSNKLEITNSHLTGNVIPPILGVHAKKEALTQLSKQHNLKSADVAAIGDGANDLEMLEAAGLGVAFEGKQLLRNKIATQLNYTGLTGLLFLQGYTIGDMVS